MKDPQQWHGLLRRMEQSVAETRSLARTLGGQPAHRETWGERLRRPVDRDARRHRPGVPVPPTPPPCARCASRLEAFTEGMRTTERSAEWPIYGALIINLRNIIDAMDVVAEANPIGGRPLPLRIPGGPARAGRRLNHRVRP